MNEGSASGFAYDFFLAYAPDDRAWAEGFLAPELGPRDRILTIQEFRPGTAQVNEVARAVQTCRYAVLVMSAAFEHGSLDTPDATDRRLSQRGRPGDPPHSS